MAKIIWKIYPYTFDTGEDIHLSASCRINSGINTVVPTQLNITNTGNLKRHYGQDHFASWKAPSFLDKRYDILKYFIYKHEWKPIEWKNM